jgi:hypothetical protein
MINHIPCPGQWQGDEEKVAQCFIISRPISLNSLHIKCITQNDAFEKPWRQQQEKAPKDQTVEKYLSGCDLSFLSEFIQHI